MLEKEKSFPKPLSGTEVAEAIANQIKESVLDSLKRDCYLAPHMAYAAFAFTFEGQLKVDFQQSAIKGTQANIKIARPAEFSTRTPVEHGESAVTAADVPKPPNDVRTENDMGVPVMVQAANGGFEEKKIKYEGRKPKKAANADRG